MVMFFGEDNNKEVYLMNRKSILFTFSLLLVFALFSVQASANGIGTSSENFCVDISSNCDYERTVTRYECRGGDTYAVHTEYYRCPNGSY